MGNGKYTEKQVQEAIGLVRRTNNATLTGVMRELKMGYTDASAIMLELESRGVVKRLTNGFRQYVVLPDEKNGSASTRIGPFDIYLADNGWCVWEGNQLIKAGIPTLEGAVTLAEYLKGKKDG